MRDFNSLVKKMPDREAVFGVFAVLVTLIYSWTLIASFYTLPSWIYFLDIQQILSVYAYSFVFDFVESVSALAIIIFLEFIVTSFVKTDREEFRARSIILIFIIMISSVIRLYNFKGYDEMAGFLKGETAWWAWTFLLCLFFGLVAPKIKWIRWLFDELADRVIIFLYIYLPLSLLSLVVVIVRNIF